MRLAVGCFLFLHQMHRSELKVVSNQWHSDELVLMGKYEPNQIHTQLVINKRWKWSSESCSMRWRKTEEINGKLIDDAQRSRMHQTNKCQYAHTHFVVFFLLKLLNLFSSYRDAYECDAADTIVFIALNQSWYVCVYCTSISTHIK